MLNGNQSNQILVELLCEANPANVSDINNDNEEDIIDADEPSLDMKYQSY